MNNLIQILESAKINVGGSGCYNYIIIPDIEIDKEETLEFMKKNDINFILKKYTGNLDFAHITYNECEESILKDGFMFTQEENEYDSQNNFGDGIYAFDIKSKDAISKYGAFFLRENWDCCSEGTLITGTYSGDYYRCAFAYHDKYSLIYNLEYIVIKNNFLPTNVQCVRFNEDNINESFNNILN